MTIYTRPPYEALKSRIQTDLAAMPAVLRDPLAAAWARACHSQHGFLEWIDRQCSPLTCELERLYDWAALYSTDRLQAVAATGNVMASGLPGNILFNGVLLRGSNGLDYIVLAAVVMGIVATPVAVRCVLPGSAGNLMPGQTLTLIDPVPGISSELTVDSAGLTGGAIEENTESWRMRVADEWRVMVARGGRSGKNEDYRLWARSAHPSISSALVQTHTLGIGSVVVRPICNNLANRTPTSTILSAVSDYLANIAPATADWRVVTPLIRPVIVAIDLISEVDSDANRLAIFSALNAVVLSKFSEASLLTMAEIDAAIASVTKQYTRIEPLSDQVILPGEVFVLSPVVWM